MHTLDEYQTETARTGEGYAAMENDLHVSILALGLTGEAGEVADLVKKVIGHAHTFDRDHFIAELGDVMWYVSELARFVDCPLSEVAAANVKKLRARYPDGFDPERSRNRTVVITNATPDGEPIIREFRHAMEGLGVNEADIRHGEAYLRANAPDGKPIAYTNATADDWVETDR